MTSLSNLSTFLVKVKGKTRNLHFFFASKDLKKTHFKKYSLKYIRESV